MNNWIRTILLEGDSEDLKEIAAYISVERTDIDLITIWITKPGDEGNANPGLELGDSRALALAEALIDTVSGRAA